MASSLHLCCDYVIDYIGPFFKGLAWRLISCCWAMCSPRQLDTISSMIAPTLFPSTSFTMSRIQTAFDLPTQFRLRRSLVTPARVSALVSSGVKGSLCLRRYQTQYSTFRSATRGVRHSACANARAIFFRSSTFARGKGRGLHGSSLLCGSSKVTDSPPVEE